MKKKPEPSPSRGKSGGLRIAFTTVCSREFQEVATGHFRRCLLVAGELMRRGHEVSIWVNQDPLVEKLKAAGVSVIFKSDWRELAPREMEGKPLDALVVDVPDEPETEASDPARLAAWAARGCALVKLGHTGKISRYYSAVISLYPTRDLWTSNYYEGTAYLVLAPKFRGVRHAPIRKASRVRRILIAMGGTDLFDLTSKAMRALDRAGFKGTADVILGAGNPNLEAVQAASRACGFKSEIALGVSDIENHMQNSDMGIVAFGTTAYEAIGLGLPLICVSHYPWQAASAAMFQVWGCMTFAGLGTEIAESELAEKIGNLLNDGAQRSRQSDAGPSLIDHCGIERVADVIESSCSSVAGGALDCLYVLAHPGDEAFGCGGTILRQVEAGLKVGVAILGDGFSARKREEFDRRWEARERIRMGDAFQQSLRALGVRPAYYYKLPDNQFDKVPLLEIIQLIESLIERHRPRTIYTHLPDDLNIDHRLTSQAVVTAARPIAESPVERLFLIETPGSSDWGHLASGFMAAGNGLGGRVGQLAGGYFRRIGPEIGFVQVLWLGASRGTRIRARWRVSASAPLPGDAPGGFRPPRPSGSPTQGASDDFEFSAPVFRSPLAHPPESKTKEIDMNRRIWSRGFSLGNRCFGGSRPVYFIAEIGSNHNGSLQRAFDLIQAAAKAGANAVKFQSWRTLALQNCKDAGPNGELLDSRAVPILQKYETPAGMARQNWPNTAADSMWTFWFNPV